MTTTLLAGVGAVQDGAQALGVEPPIHGPVWSILVPALLFVFAAGATYLLYSHFAARRSGDDS